MLTLRPHFTPVDQPAPAPPHPAATHRQPRLFETTSIPAEATNIIIIIIIIPPRQEISTSGVAAAAANGRVFHDYKLTEIIRAHRFIRKL